MLIDDATVTRRLAWIREFHGLYLDAFLPRPLDIDKDLKSSQIEELFHPSGLLIDKGQPVLVYIRDHTWFGTDLDPEQCKRVHFTVCSTLTSMKSQGRFERYRVTNRQTNRYLVDVRRSNRKTVEIEAKLYPCQNCLTKVSYRGFSYRMPTAQKMLLRNNCDAAKLFPMLRRRLHEYNAQLRNITGGSKSATLPSDYPINWSKISAITRQIRDYACAGCGVGLRETPELLDVHHIDGDKQNVNDSNLTCLCKLCHQEKHPHYRVNESQRMMIEKLRVQQGLSNFDSQRPWS